MKEMPVKVLAPLIIMKPETGRNIYLILKEENGPRTCYMLIDDYTAQILSVLSQTQNIPWPNAYNLTAEILNKAGVSIKKVVVNKLVENGDSAFYESSIYIEKENKSLEEICTRPPDAIVLALIQKTPVFVTDELLGINEDLNSAIDEATTRMAVKRTSENLSDQDPLSILNNFDERGKLIN